MLIKNNKNCTVLKNFLSLETQNFVKFENRFIMVEDNKNSKTHVFLTDVLVNYVEN